jgi:hypothetical protein
MAPRRKTAAVGLVQTTVPPSLSLWLRRQAAAEGITVAAYIRRLIMRDKTQTEKEKT